MKIPFPHFAARGIVSIALALGPLLAANAVCAQGCMRPACGYHQSPIDIDAPGHPAVYDPGAPKLTGLERLEVKLNLELTNNTGGPWCPDGKCRGMVAPGWGSLKAYPDPKSSGPEIHLGGVPFKLKEFHFHIPAEHLIQGKPAAMEVHFVFEKVGEADHCKPGAYLVLGERIQEGAENRELDKIFGPKVPLPTSYNFQPVTKVRGFQISEVLVGLADTYRYAGSLTAPAEAGCGNPPGQPEQQLDSGYFPEVVSWVVAKDPIEMSGPQIARLRDLFPKGDARDPQALHQLVKKTFPGN